MLKYYCDKCNKELTKPIMVRCRVRGCQTEYQKEYCLECLKEVLGEDCYNEYQAKIEKHKKIKE
jgi:hypothetical protein